MPDRVRPAAVVFDPVYRIVSASNVFRVKPSSRTANRAIPPRMTNVLLIGTIPRTLPPEQIATLFAQLVRTLDASTSQSDFLRAAGRIVLDIQGCRLRP